MINAQALSQTLSAMSLPMLQKYASLHRNDPYVVSLALSIANQKKQMMTAQQGEAGQQPMPKVVDSEIAGIAPRATPMPEDVGIGQLPAQNLTNMAGGGIVAFDDGGEVPRYQDRGLVQKPSLSPEQYAAYITQRAAALGIPPAMALKLFGTESSGDPTAVSPKKAVGLGQLMEAAAKDMGISKEQRTDPKANIDASLGYLKRQYDTFGTWDKALAAYNWGPRSLEKHLQKNNGRMEETGLPKETANYLNKILPFASAEAADLPKMQADFTAMAVKNAPKTTALADSSAAIPTQTPAPRSQWGAMADVGRTLLGAGETGLQYLTGLAAIPTAGGAAVLEQLPNVVSGRGANRAEMERSFREKAGDVTYQPRTEAGQAQSEGLARLLTDTMHLPPILAHIPSPYTPKGAAKAGTAVETAEALKNIAAEKTQAAETPRLGGPTTDKTMVQGKGQPPVKEGRLVEQQLKDIADARAWREAAAKADEAAAASEPAGLKTLRAAQEQVAMQERAQNVARASSPAIAAAAASPGTPPPEPRMPLDPTKLLDDQYNPDVRAVLPGPSQEDINKILQSKEPAAEAKGGKGIADLFSDPLFLLGARMMAGTSPYASKNIGEAITGAAGDLQQARKLASEAQLRELQGKYYGAYAGALERGAKEKNMSLEAEKLVQKELDTWVKTPVGQMAVLDPVKGSTILSRRAAEIRARLYPALGLALPENQLAMSGFLPGAPAPNMIRAPLQ